MADDRELRLLSKMDPSNPYYVHPNENPGLVLADPPLDGKNYHEWSRSMREGLIMENKFGFVNGSIPKPEIGDMLRNKWLQVDLMMTNWILKSVTKDVRKSVMWMDSAFEVWEDLKRRYGKINSFRLSDLLEEISKVTQGDSSMAEYYARLKSLWDEVMVLRPIPACRCAVRCSCDVVPIFISYIESEYVIRFMKGLNDAFAPVRSYVFLMRPMPNITEV